MPLSSGDKLGGYEILALIGAGGMGEVYRARDTALDRDVAIKVLPAALAHHPERLARFEREAKLLAALNHPNIAIIHGLAETGTGSRAIVMELVEGPTLADRLKSGALRLEDALAIAWQIADALEAAHEKGVVHRDLKPANVKVREDGTVKVLDFGLATAVLPASGEQADPTNSPTLTIGATEPGVIMGTAAYMSPEQARGQRVDKRADIWAFGVVLYEMVTGSRLFGGATVSDILAQVLTREPDLERAPAQVHALLRRCLDKDPKQRLRDIGEAKFLVGQVSGLPRGTGFSLWLWPAAAALATLAALTVGFVHFREPAPEQGVIKFQIPPPEKATFNGYRLSPDGRKLAFVANTAGGARLMVRPIDSLEARVLPGTANASLPFWSPDSAWIGFFVQNETKLKKVSVNGGPPQTLCDAPARVGGTWNQNGVILFSSAGSIQRVSQAGGVSAPVTKPGSGEQHLFPEFLPDGHHFLYLVRGATTESSGIYAGSLDGSAAVRLLPDASNAAYVPPAASATSGHLLFRREGTLMAQPFDADKLKLTGDLFPAAEQVGVSGPQNNGAFTASQNGVLAYGSGGSEANQELVWIDRAGKASESVVPPGGYGNFRMSLDEKSIVFDRTEANNTDIWVRDLTRGVTSRLTFDPATDNLPIWSPDGQRVLWPSKRSGSFDLYIKNAAGTGPEEPLVKMGTPSGWGTDWSRDGKFILYRIPGDKTGQDLWVAPQSGDKKPFPYLNQPFDEFDGVFSPDGHWVAYVSNETGRNEIFVQAFPVSGAKWQISQNGGIDPQWSKDGAELFFIAAGNLMATPVRTGATFVPGTPRALFPVLNASLRRNYAVSRDGKRFLVLRPVGEVAGAPVTVVVNWRETLRK